MDLSKMIDHGTPEQSKNYIGREKAKRIPEKRLYQTKITADTKAL